MSKGLTIIQDRNKFIFEGIINEFAQFRPMLEFSDEAMTLNLKGVTRINSTGVREWINALEKVDRTIEIYFEECPPIVVYQMTMIPNFTARGKVLSVYAPYYCPECENQEEILIPMNGFDLSELPSPTCTSCGAPNMEFDDDEESYFYFMEFS